MNKPQALYPSRKFTPDELAEIKAAFQAGLQETTIWDWYFTDDVEPQWISIKGEQCPTCLQAIRGDSK